MESACYHSVVFLPSSHRIDIPYLIGCEIRYLTERFSWDTSWWPLRHNHSHPPLQLRGFSELSSVRHYLACRQRSVRCNPERGPDLFTGVSSDLLVILHHSVAMQYTRKSGVRSTDRYIDRIIRCKALQHQSVRKIV
jgi:hypothetical protein